MSRLQRANILAKTVFFVLFDKDVEFVGSLLEVWELEKYWLIVRIFEVCKLDFHQKILFNKNLIFEKLQWKLKFFFKLCLF